MKELSTKRKDEVIIGKTGDVIMLMGCDQKNREIKESRKVNVLNDATLLQNEKNEDLKISLLC